jgi:hypothetical protein
MVSLFSLHCLESLTVEQCFGSCTHKKKRKVNKKTNNDSDSDGQEEEEEEDNKVKSRPATARRRFSSIPLAISERSLTDQLAKPLPHLKDPSRVPTTPAYFGVSMKPRLRHDDAQVVSIRRRRNMKYTEDSDRSTSSSTPLASVKHIRVRPRQWDPETWIAKAPRQPIDFSFGNGEYSVCVVNMSKIVAHVSGKGFVGMMRKPGSEPQGQTISQIFTGRFADLMNMLFETSITKTAPSVICIVCENISRNIISYPIIAKGKLEGLMFLWHDSLSHQEIAEMILSAA